MLYSATFAARRTERLRSPDYPQKGPRVLTVHDRTDVVAIEDSLRQFIAGSFLTTEQSQALDNDTDLFALLDSLQVLRLVVALENAFGFKVSDSELTPANLSSVERIARFVTSRLAA